MALAPSDFGSFGDDLLVGNFGDGVINAYDPVTYAYKGQLQNASGTAIANAGCGRSSSAAMASETPRFSTFRQGLTRKRTASLDPSRLRPHW